VKSIQISLTNLPSRNHSAFTEVALKIYKIRYFSPSSINCFLGEQNRELPVESYEMAHVGDSGCAYFCPHAPFELGGFGQFQPCIQICPLIGSIAATSCGCAVRDNNGMTSSCIIFHQGNSYARPFISLSSLNSVEITTERSAPATTSICIRG
jgi:hypothetical protein